jgi:hypothetical protein
MKGLKESRFLRAKTIPCDRRQTVWMSITSPKPPPLIEGGWQSCRQAARHPSLPRAAGALLGFTNHGLFCAGAIRTGCRLCKTMGQAEAHF